MSMKAQESRNLTRDFIKDHWKSTIHVNTADSGTLIGLPRPYTVPGTGGSFQEMYYWDTYFTNAGLLGEGMVQQAKNNVDNMIYLVNRYGFMPNGNRTFFLVRSQPPYLSMMIRDVYERTKDREWLRNVLPALEREYRFWMRERMSPTGLNRYGEMAGEERKRAMFASADKRLKVSAIYPGLSDSMKIVLGAHFIAECESGWDFTPRFAFRCMDYNPVDLNCNLYMYEKNFSFFYKETHSGDPYKWERAAMLRKQRMQKYCRNPEDGLYYDYDFVNGKRSSILSAAVFNLLWSRMADKENAEAIVQHLNRLEAPFGIVACEKTAGTVHYGSPENM
ncbi:MAG: trehalase family glycosidase [Niabella sp.]